MNRASFLVTVTQPPGVSEQDLLEHIRTALHAEGGQLRPNDPLFGEAIHPLEVKPLGPDNFDND